MAFFGGGIGGWKGSSWSPWSQWMDGGDDNSTTDDPSETSNVPVIATSEANTPAPTPTPTPTPTQAPAVTTPKSTKTPSPTPTPTPIQSITAKTSGSDLPPAAPPPSSASSNRPAVPSISPTLTSATVIQVSGTSRATSTHSGSSSGSASSSNAAALAASSSTSSSSSFASSSSSSVLPGGWEYFGCVPHVNGVPALNTTYATSDELTPALCVNACAASQYHFAGLVNGNSCFCGSIAVSYATTSSSSCSTPCTGESSITCGGKKAMSFYKLSPYDPTETFYANPTLAGEGEGGDLADVTKYLDRGSRTEIATMPTFTGSLIGAGSPHFRDSLHGVVFGQLIRASSEASSLRPGMLGKGDYRLLGIATLVVWFFFRMAR
ncbi:hypothetical protein IAU59_006119 [Kwoniella sp. CBS 9459]